MYLKYTKALKESTLTVSMYCSNFTTDETKAIRQLGAPHITLSKAYEVSGVTVDIDVAVPSLNVTQDFSGNTDTIQDVLAEGNEFISDVAQAITEVMVELMTQYKLIKSATNKTSGQIKIQDGSEPSTNVLSGGILIEDVDE